MIHLYPKIEILKQQKSTYVYIYTHDVLSVIYIERRNLKSTFQHVFNNCTSMLHKKQNTGMLKVESWPPEMRGVKLAWWREMKRKGDYGSEIIGPIFGCK